MRLPHKVGDLFRHKDPSSLNTMDKIEIVSINYKDRLYNMKLTYEGLVEDGGSFYFFDLEFDRIEELFTAIEEFLTVAEKQLILYSKNHFKKTDMIEDLKVFAGVQYDLYTHQVPPHSIYHMVVNLFFKLMEKGYIETQPKSFIMELFKSTEDKLDYKAVISKMMAFIQWVKADGLNLGKSDHSLLPMKTKEE